jgi:SAM-dependent methyltransferase
MIFADYASYYDLMNQDKNYTREAEYICRIIRNLDPVSAELLDLGCGTGQHDRLLSAKGFKVTGIDMAAQMIEIARRSQQSAECPSTSFMLGDIRKIRLGETFDAVISIFHVMSYQTGNRDLYDVFSTANDHLKPGGLFIFDFWYGPAVLTQRPTKRIKHFSTNIVDITRYAEPRMLANNNVVEVDYLMVVKDLHRDQTHEIRETHRMRYLFKPEIDWLASLTGFSEIAFKEWLTDADPGFSTWGAYCILRKVGSLKDSACPE